MGEILMSDLMHNLIEFVFGQHNRLSCIKRYNNTPKLSEESVAEHSYYVAVMAMLIADYLSIEKDIIIDVEDLLRMALLHDLEEIISGDIIKVLKSGGFKEELDKMNERSMHFLVDGLGRQGEYYFNSWKSAKNKMSLEAKIIDLVDWLAILVYCVKEIHMGNKYFVEILEYVVEVMPKYTEDGLECLNEPVNAFSKYARDYLKDNKEIYAAINKAVRVPSDEEKD